MGSGDPGSRNGGSGGHHNPLSEFSNLDVKIKQEPPNSHGMSLTTHQHQAAFIDETLLNSPSFPSTFPTSGDSGTLSNMELTNILTGSSNDSIKHRKQHRKRVHEDSWKKRKSTDDPELMDASSCDSTSRSTPLSQGTCSEIPTPNSALGFNSDFEGLDPSELMTDKNQSQVFENVEELSDMDEMLPGNVHKFRRKSPTPTRLDLEDKTIIPPSVSITPIQTSSVYNQTGCTRPGIEIVPIGSSQSLTTPISTSITITPITPSQVKSDDKIKEKKSGGKRSEDRNKGEKKRKKRRDEGSPMGPPEKIPCKQDPLSKPVNVCIKPSESPPLSPGMSRKFAASPTQNRKISSPNFSNAKVSALQQSPKHTPMISVTSSPKHVPGISSPKSHTMSPKHPSMTSGGKPSMSTLKNATSSPSSIKSVGDSSKTKSGGKESSRDKDKRSSSTFNAAKKSSSLKMKQVDLNAVIEVPNCGLDNLPSPGGSIDLSKSSGSGQARNRKSGNLLAVIDKLKSAQHCDLPTDLSGKSKSSGQNSGKNSETSKTSIKMTNEAKSSEYMVKPSSDGMKITINKTRMKDSKSSVSGTGSPKTHTGLKPGVTSGPASKKPQQVSLFEPRHTFAKFIHTYTTCQ